MVTQSKNQNKKLFPYEFEAKKELLFYPTKPQRGEPDIFLGDILEIGPGRGDSLLFLAQNDPAKKFVAVEIGKKRYFRLIPRLEKKEIKNVFLIRGDARVVLPQFFKEGTFEKIYVLFPDPWPKDRHSFRRLLTLEFLSLLAHHLRKDGELVIATDVESYANATLENLKQIQSLQEKKISDDSPLPLQTFFEQKWRGQGKKIHTLLFVKKSSR